MEGISAVNFVDKEGNVIEFLRYEGTGENTPKPASLPVSLDWYRDATKWLITLAAGAAVLGLGFFDKSVATLLQRILFSASGIALLVAILIGIFCHLWIISYANEWEYAQPTASDGNPTPSTAAELGKSLNTIGLLYYGLLWSFFIGMLLFGALGFAKLWQQGQQDMQGPFSVTPLAANGGAKAVLWDTKKGELWLIEEAGGVYRLRKPEKERKIPAAKQP